MDINFWWRHLGRDRWERKQEILEVHPRELLRHVLDCRIFVEKLEAI